MLKEAFTIPEFAEIIGVSERTAATLVADGSVKSVLLAGRNRRILRAHVQEFLDSQGAPLSEQDRVAASIRHSLIQINGAVESLAPYHGVLQQIGDKKQISGEQEPIAVGCCAIVALILSTIAANNLVQQARAKAEQSSQALAQPSNANNPVN